MEVPAEGVGGGGGSSWELSISTEGLNGAASQYSGAAQNYSTALAAIESNLRSALNSWQDSSKETWEAKVKVAVERMQRVGARMSQNAAVLSDIATAAGETETNVKNKISTL